MKKTEPVIKNKLGEKLDTWVETPDCDIVGTVVMVHGFGTNKYETAGYFDDISQALTDNSYRVVRFDLSGYGLSEGKQEDACYSKHQLDLKCIIDYIQSTFEGPVNIFAQSMGCFVTALSMPANINKTIMTGLPNADPQIIIDRVTARFGSRPGAKLDMSGISLMPRSTGAIQSIGPAFWRDLRALKPVSIISEYSKITKLLVVSWNNDEILGTETLDQYDAISDLTHIWLDGDHAVAKPLDRQNFIKVMLDYYNKK
ncbi:alpha/beta fold hydrolase [Candidatus Woesebacteria bacterium]|nr:alpha/beta fold hydrolase [Candidatus Woesebacteria bacterium]